MVAQEEYLLWNTFLHVDAKGRAFSKPEASVHEQLYAYIDASVLEVLSEGILAHKDFNTMVAIKSFQDFIPILVLNIPSFKWLKSFRPKCSISFWSI